eukprot:scaffold64206_cov75-Cyclotella_meneghiniana.AAC.8
MTLSPKARMRANGRLQCGRYFCYLALSVPSPITADHSASHHSLHPCISASNNDSCHIYILPPSKVYFWG